MASNSCGGEILIANVDRISNLPDHLLSIILSNLPTKCAVGTCILSTRWKYVWTSITSFHFEGPRIGNNVVHVLCSCRSSKIQKFILSLHMSWGLGDFYVKAWINRVIERGVSELDIQGYDHMLKLPMIFSCRTLKILTFDHHCRFDVDINLISFDLPCLKVLHIIDHSCLCSFIEKLISSCPVLEDFTLTGNPSDVMVSAPNMKRLQLSPLDRRVSRIPKISVKAPNLEYFHLSDYFILYDIKGDFSSVVKAQMNLGDCLFPRTFEFRSFPCPKFHNLKCLVVMITRHNIFWSLLLNFVRMSPSLEVLSIEQHGDDMLRAGIYTWDEPASSPKCLRAHLAVIKIKGFTGRKHELDLLRYFLETAKVLQRLTISSVGVKIRERRTFHEHLLSFWRASRQCQIEFQG